MLTRLAAILILGTLSVLPTVRVSVRPAGAGSAGTGRRLCADAVLIKRNQPAADR